MNCDITTLPPLVRDYLDKKERSYNFRLRRMHKNLYPHKFGVKTRMER